MATSCVMENAQLSRFDVLVAQLESIVASAAHKPPDGLLCFDLLSDLIAAVEEEGKESIMLWQRKCEDALYSLLVLGACRPARHLASMAMTTIILKGDSISIYSRASSLQGFLSNGKKSDAKKVTGATQCLGELYRYFGRRIASGLLETTSIVAKLLKFPEDFVRQEALQMLRNALVGSDGSAASAAYIEAFRLITRTGVGDKSVRVRVAAARCLKAFANIGGPGLGIGELENCSSYCVKALEDPVKSVRDAFAEALGALLALGMNPDAQVQPKGKGHSIGKMLEGSLQKHLAVPFAKVGGLRLKDLRVGIALSWVCFLQTMCLKYLHQDSELEKYALHVMDMLRSDAFIDAQALACVLYIMRVGITDQMSEPTQRSFSVFLAKQFLSSDSTPSMRVAALRTLSYVLKTLGELPLEFKEVIDDTVVASLNHDSHLVRVEAALTLRMLAEVDPSCVGGLISYAMTMLSAARENVSFEKGFIFKKEIESLHGQAAAVASLVSISWKLPLGYPTRLPQAVLQVCKSLLMDSSRNPVAAAVEKEAGWNLMSSLLTSMSKEELHDQAFDILALWASTFSGNPKHHISQTNDLTSEICMWSAAVDALTSYVKCFISSDNVNRRILLQPVLLYLNRALANASQLAGKEQAGVKSSADLFILRVLIAYEALSDPSLYKLDHVQIIQICTTPFREPSKCDESSCLRLLLDKRDAWLGPWTPGRDWFEDELRSFQGGKDDILTCVSENEPHSFPLPDTTSKMLVNQMLLCFGVMFASQDSSGMMLFIGMIDQCLKTGKKQAWHIASVTNICVGLLAGLKTLLTQRPEPLGMDILSAIQAIFQSILAEGDICASQRRASSEGLGLLARLGNDIFTARMTKQLLGDITGGRESYYTGSVAFALGCIHRSAGGMTLSSLVPSTVNIVSVLARKPISTLQIWSLHGLLLTIEAAGLSYISQVQATLGLAMEIILSEESGGVDLQQAVGRLINAIIAIIGPELAPGSIFFSRCKSAIGEISSSQETATLIESVRFTQQLVVFAPQAVTMHSHVLTLLPTLSSRQPTLRHLALSTLRHLIEKDPVPIIDEQIEETLFHVLDEETDTEIINLARATIMRLLHASCPSHPSHWLSICRAVILSTTSRYNASKSDNMVNDDSSTRVDGENSLNTGNDDENMVSSSRGVVVHSFKLDYSSPNFSRDKHFRYRTRVFAAECLNHLPEAVGESPSHFDLSLARRQSATEHLSGDWLVLQLPELISLAYQISTIQFEKMRPIGVSLLCAIMDKFAASSDPELPDCLLLEQYQAQLVSAVRSSLDSFSNPILLEAGLQLATKMLTSGIISRDQAAVKRIFSLISRPLDHFKDLYYPSYAEWVSCKIKVRLLTVHASLKCYMFSFLSKQDDEVPDKYLALLPLFAKSSSILGLYWLSFLKDYIFVHFHVHSGDWKSLLDGFQSSSVSVELQQCLEEAWPVILQALVMDAIPVDSNMNESSSTHRSYIPTSGYSMVELRLDDFKFLWGFSLLVLFQEQDVILGKNSIPVIKSKHSSDILVDDSSSFSSVLHNIFFPVFKFMSTERFFTSGFLPLDACRELVQAFSYLICREDTWDCLAVFFISQIVQNCPNDFLEMDDFSYLVMELCLASVFKFLLSGDVCPRCSSWEKHISAALKTAATLLEHSKVQMQLKFFLPLLLIGYKCIGEASTEISLSRTNNFVQSILSILKRAGTLELDPDCHIQLVSVTRECLNATASLTNECIQAINRLENKKSESRKMLLLKLAYSVEQLFSLAALAFELEGHGDRQESNPVLYRVLHLSIQAIQAVLADTNIQVQAIGLQVMKVMLQKGIGAESNSFLIFYVGELIDDLFIILTKIMGNTITREAIAISRECLKILMLMQTLSKGTVYEKGLLHLLLEAILLTCSTSDGSQEANELNEVAVKLVSQVAQIPTSAAFIKDILLSMASAQRQQLQDIIRASMVQDKNPKLMSSVPPIVIKLPTQSEQIEEKRLILLDPPKGSNNVSSSEEDEDEDEDEDDDWDTFQSFPASTSETAPPWESLPSTANISKNDDYLDEYSASPSLSNNENIPRIEGYEPSETHTADVPTEWNRKESYINGVGQEIDGMISRISGGEFLVIQTEEEPTECPSDDVEKTDMAPTKVSGLADDKLLPDIQIEEEHEPLRSSAEKAEMGPGHENDEPLSDVTCVDSTKVVVRDANPSVEHHTGADSEFDEGPSADLSTESASGENVSIFDYGKIVEKEGQAVLTDDSEGQIPFISEDPGLEHRVDTHSQSNLSVGNDSDTK